MAEPIVNDEIDLLELLEIIWSGKWLIAIVTGLSSIATALFLLVTPGSVEMSLAIRPLSPQQISAYAPLNNVPGISPPIYAGTILIGQTGVVLSKDLFNAVKNDISSRRSIRQAITELDPQIASFEGTQEEQQELVIRKSGVFTIKNNKNSDDFELVTKTTRPALTREIFSRFVKLNRDRIRRQNLIALANLNKSIATSLNYEIETIEQEITNTRNLYKDRLKTRLANLKEQAKIARALGLERPMQMTNVTTSVNTGNEAEDSPETFQDAFQRGYKALEEEIRQLDSRKENAWTLFTPEYPQLGNKLRQLKTDQRLARIEQGLLLTPLSDAENFQPANFDLDNIKTVPSTSKLLILILMSILAGIGSSVFVLIRHYVKQRQAVA